jgi:hypothetical protein
MKKPHVFNVNASEIQKVISDVYCEVEHPSAIEAVQAVASKFIELFEGKYGTFNAEHFIKESGIDDFNDVSGVLE